MDQKYLYLAIDFFSILFPFIFSFYSKHNFSKKWKYAFPGILLTALFFIIWDEWFTQMGVWGFNPRYLTGIKLSSLPIEEILFFICIPYACMFTYEAVNYLIKWRMDERTTNFISDALIFGLFISGILTWGKWYTSLTCILTAVFIFLHRRIWKSDYAGKFYFAYLFILIPFFIVNGILTGTGIEEEVVWYNNNENLGLRMGTIPVEDTIYGMLMLFMSISIFEYLQKKKGPAKAPLS